jgi:hypothetical protein
MGEPVDRAPVAFGAEHFGPFDNCRDLRCCGRRKLTPVFPRTQQSPWVTKGFVMIVAASNPGLVTKPSQGTRPPNLARNTLSQPRFRNFS